jgi:ABC-2 type transport system permease protein
MRTLPLPRLVYLLADMTVWMTIVLPGVVFAIIVGVWRFGLDLQVSPLIVPAILLVIVTATGVGYAIASLLPQMLANLLTQILVVFVLMFSPLTFPAERLPDWLATLHSVLPVQAMGEVIRGTLAGGTFPLSPWSFVLLGGWCVVTLAVTSIVLTRRG